MKSEKISELTTKRLSIYLRCLQILDRNGIQTVSSRAMAEQFHLNSAQIRKDLAYFGEFGVRGVGYSVSHLAQHLTKILGLDSRHRLCICGAGNLGRALAEYGGFNSEGFQMVALFDTDAKKIGTTTRTGVPIYDIKKLKPIVVKENVDIAVVTVPSEVAQKVVDLLCAAGIKAILNFAPVHLRVNSGIKLQKVDLKVELENLSYYLSNPSVSAPANLPE
ncbi:MAG: redox-sensing transcriptional repressor Rex [Acidobacteriia bacterium]|nr:redox-sensing transcriptional repressor Rex [Terriglobia bacterium]